MALISRQKRNPGIQIGVGSGGTQKCNAFLEDPVKREERLANAVLDIMLILINIVNTAHIDQESMF